MFITLMRYFRQKFGNDAPNILWLIGLYLIQGIPLGLTFGTVPFFLHKSATYTQIGIFSFATLPYSFKILWSPLIDSIYNKRFGRRKSWIVPTQLVIGTIYLVIASHIEQLIEDSTTHIWTLTIVFLVTIILVATQDIAVDGWALTILSKKHLHHGSTCQTIGLTTGYFISYTIFMILNSSNLANHFRAIPTEEGLVSLSGYIFFWGVIYIVVSIYLALYKPENPPAIDESETQAQEEVDDASISHQSKDSDGDEEESIEDISSQLEPLQIYKMLYRIVSLPHIQTLCIMFIASKIVFQSNETMSLRLMEKGMAKEDLATFSLIGFPFTILFSVLAGKLVKDKPLSLWTNAYLLGILCMFCNMMTVIYFQRGWMYYIVLLLFSLLTSFVHTMMSVSQGSFFLKISDKAIGGTYLTFLNTIANFAGTWPKFPVLYIIDKLSKNVCRVGSTGEEFVHNSLTEVIVKQCETLGGVMENISDGYFIVTVIFIGYGLFMYRMLKSKFVPIQYIKPMPIVTSPKVMHHK
ncbi:hypothetical protein SAMD00019534_024010 [Acytostelium subglobosum LB1]|uniref:hypothetical protein n=1 Tax=Acytostelium subglobosum LB1 TaxID=1410327 RepID=UPI000644B779|nr:hypothetical protein SAMD00019534_024010 [Acytostelium subglobosum LB1]GAM19226.1 hypothetical protein SAMD00019534_024010 [Acytostelium subglobosum LB1]|eukprot:XP_012757153.1 hypothetical protein SAMD00019534_024010 [Acytostelium subglobosum LB1]